MRDIFTIASEAKVPPRYQLTVGEIIALLDTMPFLHYISGATDLTYEAIITAFEYGYVKGCRSERARVKRAKK